MTDEGPEGSKTSDVVALWALAFAASSIIGSHGIAYWDAGDYTLLALTGGKSGLLLGRPLFLWTSRLVLSLGVDPASAEVVLRWFWSGVGAIAAPLLAVLAVRLGLDRRSALVAGLALALSPSFAHTSHQVLTDAPALVLSIAALIAALAGQPVRTGLLLAAAIATRETAAVHLVSASLLLGARRGFVSVAACGLTLGGIIAIYQPPGIAHWFSAMSQSSVTHPWSVIDLLKSLLWVLTAGPALVFSGLVALWRRDGDRRERSVTIPAAIATVLLLFYPDGGFSPRYVLATVPFAFFINGARWFSTRPMLLAIAFVIPFAIAMIPAARVNAVAKQGATLNGRVPALPRGAVVVPGHFCPQARLAAQISNRPDLRYVCPGWGWPQNLAETLDRELVSGAPVAVDASDDAWMRGRELVPHAEVRAWLAGKVSESVGGFSVVQKD